MSLTSEFEIPPLDDENVIVLRFRRSSAIRFRFEFPHSYQSPKMSVSIPLTPFHPSHSHEVGAIGSSEVAAQNRYIY